ncbi:MAG: biopolymer transporter ExbD [Planctomycetota bacterium]
MNLDTDNLPEETSADLTPLIDVVFQLLIFFLLATTFADPERELELELPTAESGERLDEEPEELVLEVLEDGSVHYGRQKLSPGQLAALLEDAAARNPATSITIRGHRGARHEAIVAVLDACGVAGLSRLAIGTRTSEGS